MTIYQGTCLCGELTFQYDGPSLWCAHCHCTMCQQAHGAPLVTWVGVAEQRFQLLRTGSLKWYRSSAEAERGFCGNCGATLFFRSTRWPGEMHIVRTNISGEIDLAPNAHVHRGSQPGWFEFSDTLPDMHGESGGAQ